MEENEKRGRHRPKIEEKSDVSNERNGIHPKFKLLSETVFCFHAVLIITFIVLTFLCPLYLIVVILLVQRGMFWYFDGCIVTHLERKICGNEYYDFLREFAYRMTGIEISRGSAKTMNVVIFASIAILAIVIFFYKKFWPTFRK
jgi:hypothetical protein